MTQSVVRFIFKVSEEGSITEQQVFPTRAAKGMTIRFTASRDTLSSGVGYAVFGKIFRGNRTNASIEIYLDRVSRQVRLYDLTRSRGRGDIPPSLGDVEIDKIMPEPEPVEEQQKTLVFTHKQRNGLSVVNDNLDSCYQAVEAIQKQLNTFTYGTNYHSTVQVVNDLLIGADTLPPAIQQSQRVDDLARLRRVAKTQPLTINGREYRAEFPDPSSLENIEGVEINPEGMVELYGSAISTTMLYSRNSPPSSVPLNGDGAVFVPGQIGYTTQFRRTRTAYPSLDQFGLMAYHTLLLDPEGGKRDIAGFFPEFTFFSNQEEVEEYNSRGGVLLSVAEAGQIINARLKQQYREKKEYSYKFLKFDGVEFLKPNVERKVDAERGFNFYLLKISELGEEDSYTIKGPNRNLTVDFNSGSAFVRGSFSVSAMEQLFIRYVYYVWLGSGSDYSSELDPREDTGAGIINALNDRFKPENFKKSLSVDIVEARQALEASLGTVNFRVLVGSEGVFPKNYVGAGRPSSKVSFKEIVENGFAVQVLDPPQLGSLKCFRSAIAYMYPHLLHEINFDDNDYQQIEAFCVLHDIPLKRQNDGFTSQEYIVSKRLSSTQNIKIVKDLINKKKPISEEDLIELKVIEPEVNCYLRVSTIEGSDYVVYPKLITKPQLLVHQNHVYVVARLSQLEETNCSKCSGVCHPVLVKGLFVCDKCAKKIINKPFKCQTQPAAYDEETVPVLQADGTVRFETVSIDFCTSNYFYNNLENEEQRDTKPSKELIAAFAQERKVDFATAKFLIKNRLKYLRYQHFLSRDVTLLIKELNSNEYTQEQAIKILSDQLNLKFYEFSSNRAFLEQLKELSDMERYYSCFAHNASRFDSILLIADSMRTGGFNDKKFLPVGNSVLEFQVFSHRFLDSFKLAAVDLATLSNDFKLGRFSKLKYITASDGTVYNVKELFNLRESYGSVNDFYQLLKEMGLYDGFIEYSKLDVISLILIVIIFKEMAMKICNSIIESYDWYQETPEQFMVSENTKLTNKQFCIATILSKVFDHDCMTIGQIEQSLITAISDFVSSDSFYQFLGYEVQTKRNKRVISARSAGKEKLTIKSLSPREQEQVDAKVSYYRRNVSIPIEPDQIDNQNVPSEHQVIESKCKVGGNSWINKKYNKRMIISREHYNLEQQNILINECVTKGIEYLVVDNITYIDVKSEYPAVMLGTRYYELLYPDSPFLPVLKQIMEERDYYPIYNGKESVTETTGATVSYLLSGGTIPTSSVEWKRHGNDYYSEPVTLDWKSSFTCHLDMIVKTKDMWNIIPSRSGETLDWDSPNLMSKNYRQSLTEQQYQQLVSQYGPFTIEDYLVANEIQISEFIRYQFGFKIAENEYAVIYHRKTREHILYNYEMVIAQLKKQQDDFKASKDERYNEAKRTILKFFMNIPSGKLAQNFSKTKKCLLSDDADIFESNNYETVTIFNQRLVVDEKNISGTFCYIGNRIYALAKKLFYWYVARDGFENTLKAETDGWATINTKCPNKDCKGQNMGELEFDDVKKMAIIAKKCSIIDTTAGLNVTFKGCSMGDLINYGKKPFDQSSPICKDKKDYENQLKEFSQRRAFDEMLQTGKLEIPIKLFKRNLFGGTSNVSVVGSTKKFCF